MNEFERGLVRYMGEDKLKKIQRLKVGIAGAGGLGSNCAFNLVRSGLKRLKIIDFDVVKAANLNRQFYFFDQVGMPKVVALKTNLLRINLDLELEAVQNKIIDSNIGCVFRDCDVVVEAFDEVICKIMIIETFFSSGKLLVAASGLGGWGSSDDIIVREIHPKFYLIGDLMSEVNADKPPVSPRVNIVAAKQADVILDCIIKGLI